MPQNKEQEQKTLGGQLIYANITYLVNISIVT